MTAPKTRREQEFEAFKKAWEEYPSQDNEGFVPDRGGFKCGWFAALRWADSTPAPSDVGDEEAANKYWREHRDFHDSDGVDVCQVFKDGAAHARRTQAERMIRLQNANDGLKKVVSHYFAEIERLKKELEWHRTQHGKDLVKTVGDVHGVLVSENQELRALLQRAMRQLQYVSEGHTSDGDIECVLKDYERMKGGAG